MEREDQGEHYIEINGFKITEVFVGTESLETVFNRDIRAILLTRPDLLKKTHGE